MAIIYFLTGYFAFEEFVLKLLPVSDVVYSYLRFVGELLIYAAFGRIVFHKLYKGIPFVKTPIDFPVLGFYVVVFLSMVLNNSPLMGSLYNIRPVARYIVLFYLIVNSPLSKERIATVLRIIFYIGIIQIGVGLIQWIGGPTIYDFFMPRALTLEVAGYTKEFRLLEIGREIGSIYGTLGDTVIYGVFMIIILIIFLSRVNRLEYLNLLGIAILLLFIARSYSRAATFSAMLACVIWYFFHYGWKKTLQITFILCLIFSVVLAIVNPFELEYINPRKAKVGLVGNVTGVFSGSYVKVAQKQRLGSLIGNVPTVLINKPILGYGADQNTTIERLNESKRSFLLKILSKKGFKDVYWVAILCFYGVLGLGMFMFIFYRLFMAAFKIYKQTLNKLSKEIAMIMLCLVVVTMFLLFFNRTLEFRGYGFYFWMCAGLMFASDTSLETYKRIRITL